MGYGPGDKGIPSELGFFQESAPPNSRTVYPHVQKSEKYCQETFMENKKFLKNRKKKQETGEIRGGSRVR